MSEVISYKEGFESDAQITKMATFSSKGGGLVIQIQLPLDAELAGVIAMHLGNIAKINMKFSVAKAKSVEDAEGSEQGELALDALDAEIDRE